MKKAFKIIIPILLALAIILCMGWYLFIYDQNFTRDMLLQGARYFDSNGYRNVGAWFYDLAYQQAGDNDAVAIELAQQHKKDGNYTQAESVLTRAIEDGGGVDLYTALCKTYVEQDKLLDAVKLLNGITNQEVKAQLDALRPAAPTASPEPGFYNQYISVTIEAESGTLYVNAYGEYPSIYDAPYSEPIALGDGENTLYAVAVAENGLVSPVSIFGYTVGGIIEEVTFADDAVEKQVRQMLDVDEDDVLYTNELWDILSFTVPAEATSYEDLKHMIFLEELTISGGPSNALAVLSSMPNLVSLSITDTPVSTDELEIISSLSKLETLTLNDCGLSTVAGLENLTSLTYLDLSNNTVRNITPLASLTDLQEVYLQHNALTDLSSLSGLNALVTLDVSYNALTTLSPITGLSNLVWLDASNNTITEVAQVGRLTSLQNLSVAYNTLTDVSALAQCTSLTQLDVSNNTITDISALAALTKLTKLVFSYNEITELPAFSTDCALVTIDGSHNLLETLEPLSGLSNLNNVYMDYNEAISSVECLADCPVLILVNVYGTAVTEVSSLTDQSIIVNFNPTQTQIEE